MEKEDISNLSENRDPTNNLIPESLQIIQLMVNLNFQFQHLKQPHKSPRVSYF